MTTIAPAASAASATTASSTAGTSTGTLDFTQNFNTFLTLLTAQLKNQDPLSPMDTNAFTQQLVSFSQVEQQINTNSNLQQLIQLQTAGQTLAAMPLVGQSIEYNNASAPLQNGQASYVYTLPSNATQTSLLVQDANGNVVYSTAGETAVGAHSFSWNGQTTAGQQMPDGGTYTLNVVASGAGSKAITAAVQSIGTVSSVSVANGTPTFDVDGISVPMSGLVTVLQNHATSTGN
jgi:flagellar basal-body rod modification protein FlgD